ncbi:Adaptor protein complex AP-2 alpha subunit [Dimargaris cristalligena]|uniref:AP-2 complex subunit alpha n=1 Tax=Dimargaris cristalligena TaxID=215637 RepID=A0A4P9ZW42_9FUNG|nr:Adaptor protein complex AP-2 alpha subunit [Dimargaris cristalligena]|eukprot:RKP37823.1 Adaptor protein complex AP-2 alpha subunit [Dimargaris cristalligena]
MSMRGLTVFIADLRKCRIHELEEKRINKEMANIRAKFKESNLKGYQKKKYVCKLLYMYILGWDIDFGHAEAVNLISSNKFSEKQMGYLAVTLLLTENSDLIRLVVNSIRKDLDSQNELFNCLALHAIANIGGREMAETVSGEVQKLLISPISKSFVKKKAALCLLRLFRKHSDVLPAVEWAERILPILDDPDIGVATSAASLITALAQQYPQQYAMCVPKAIRRLYRAVIDKEYIADYVYYKVPAPWLQVKLLRLLQYYPIPDDEALRTRILTVLHAIVQNSRDIPRNIQHANALHAILFEAINLIIHIGCEPELLAQSAFLLGRFIASKETNVRYLGLETMAHLAGALDNLDPIKKHQDLIMASLRDRDVSVRRRGLDLLYSMCDVGNSRVIVRELLRYLPMADYALREEMVLKIAILTEKFATEYQWYIDTIMKLLSTAGDQVGEEIWYRLIQIVLSNESLQEYAARVVLSALRSPHCHENALKVGAYVLGEFGHLIANETGCSPMEQFKALHARFSTASLDTKVMLLTTYLKFVNLFPEIKEACVRVFERYRYALHIELQQRACEYYNIATRDSDDLLQTICEEMPPFPVRESALVSRLQKQHLDTEDKRTWVVGGKEANIELKSQDGRSIQNQGRAAGTIITNATLAAAAAAAGSHSASDTAMAGNGGPQAGEVDLLNLHEDLSSLVLVSKNLDSTDPSSEADSPLQLGVAGTGFQRLLYTTQGVLYEDDDLQIGIKSEFHGYQGRLVIYTGNQTGDVLNSFTLTVHSAPHLKATTVQAAPNLIQPFAQAPYLLNLECQDLFPTAPVIQLTYCKGNPTPTSLFVQLPVALTKFVEPFHMPAADFFGRWRQIGTGKRESQSVFKAPETFQKEPHRALLRGLGFALLDDADPNENNLVGVGIFVTVTEKIGCLMRLEPSIEHQMYRLTVRTTSDKLSLVMREHIEEMVESLQSY